MTVILVAGHVSTHGHRTHRDGVDEGSDAQRQAAAQQREDGVAQVVVDGDGQRASGHEHGGLHRDHGRLDSRVLLPITTSVLRRRSIALQPHPGNTTHTQIQ